MSVLVILVSFDAQRSVQGQSQLGDKSLAMVAVSQPAQWQQLELGLSL